MTTDFATVAGLLVAGLGAVYAYARLGTRPTDPGVDVQSASGAMRNGGKKTATTKGGGGEGDVNDRGRGRSDAPSFSRVVPGGFEGSEGEHAGSGQTASGRGEDGKTRRRRKKKAGRVPSGGRGKDGNGDGEGDTSAAASASAARPWGRAMGKEGLEAGTGPSSPSHPRPHPAAPQPRGIRPSLSLDADRSWAAVDGRHLEPGLDGQAPGRANATGGTTAVLASPASERTDSITTDGRGARADLVQRTLAERAPRPSKTGLDGTLGRPDFPTLTRVMRVQPPADETPVPGFSWDDYGEVVLERSLARDGDGDGDGEEDEGWDVVRGRNHIRTSQTRTQTQATTTTDATSRLSPASQTTTTKKQRQNARKKALAKSARAEVELARLEGLAKHKRELERLRVLEQSRQGGGKRPSGGMAATVDGQGKLVWE